jgi:hypothetical protein
MEKNEIEKGYKCLNNYKRLLRGFDLIIEADDYSQFSKYTLLVARSIVHALAEQVEQQMDDSVLLTSTVVPPPV